MIPVNEYILHSTTAQSRYAVPLLTLSVKLGDSLMVDMCLDRDQDLRTTSLVLVAYSERRSFWG
jgi:hypothetical protein